MAYDVLVFAMTDAEIFRHGGQVPKPGFAEDIPIETHAMPKEKIQVWVQRMTSKVMADRVQQIAMKCDEDAVSSIRTLHCPHNESVLDDDLVHYLGMKLMFCHDCAMIFAGELLETQRGYFSALDGKSRGRHFHIENNRTRWLATRKINWVHCGGPRVQLEPYKKQLGF